MSEALVADTIELDNEAEHRLPHRTTRPDGHDAPRGAPWLVSFALWANVLQYVGPDGITVADLRAQARTDQLLLGGPRRWGYVALTPPAGQPPQNPPQDAATVSVKRAGRMAQEARSELPAVVEKAGERRDGWNVGATR